MGNSVTQKTKVKDNQAKQKKLTTMRWQGGINQSFRELINSNFSQNIDSLSLDDCRIGPQGIKILASVEWPFLNNLILSENRVQDKGIAYLVKCHMPKLVHLNLLGNFLRYPSCKIVTKANWPLLETITFNDKDSNQRRLNIITNFGVLELKKISNGRLNCKQTEKQYKLFLDRRKFEMQAYLWQ